MTLSVRRPTRPSRLARVAVWSFVRPRRAIAAWFVALVALTGIGHAAGSAFRDDFSGGNSQSEQAQSLLARTFHADAGDHAQIVFQSATALTAPQLSSRVEAVLARARGVAHVTGVSDPLRSPSAGQITADRRTAYATVQFDQTTDKLPSSAPNRLLHVVKAGDQQGLHVVVGGAPIAKVEKPKFGKSEGIGLIAALIILLFAFGALIAAGLPIVTALFGLGASFGVLDLISHGQTVPSFAPELAALLGIGVGIDYALFIVTRYREQLAEGAAPTAAVATALSTSGKAVLFAGGTVVVSLLGLFVVGLPYITGAALGAIFAVLLVMLSALTLLPALLGALGPRIDKFSLRRRRSTVGDGTLSWRWSQYIQRHPVPAAALAVAGLVALSLPLFAIRVGYGDAGNNPKGTETRMAYDLLASHFGAGAVGPLVLAAAVPNTPNGAQALSSLDERIAQLPDVLALTAPKLNAARDTAVVAVVPRSAPQDETTKQLVRNIRRLSSSSSVTEAGVRVLVGGETASSIDSSTHLSHRLAAVIVFVVALSMLLLLAALRSPVIAVKAAVMNLLSTGAAYGVIVAAFQWGWLGSGLTAGRTGPIDPWIPVMLFTILFGLSMDYELFLMTRVREHWLRHGSGQAAVTDGLASTARVISAAAAIMVCVFASFALSDERPLRIFGLGMATAVLVDATVVRMVLVPSIMQLLGRAAWWLPGWLDRVIPAPVIEPLPVRDEPAAA